MPRLPLTSADLQTVEVRVRLDDPDLEPVCARCGAALEVLRAAPNADGRRPPISVTCTADPKHLLVHYQVRPS